MKGAKFVLWIIIAAISIALIGFTSWAARNSAENRSRAATAKEKTYKAWEFEGFNSGAEEWNFTNFSGTRVSNGELEATFSKKNSKTVSSAALTNSAVFTTLPYGAKSLKIRLSVDTPTKDGRGIPATVTYWMKGKPSRPLSFTVSEGPLAEITLPFPEILAIPIDKLEISFTDYQPGSKLAIDWIRLVGTVPSPTPYPTKQPTPTPEPFPTSAPTPTSYPTPSPKTSP